MLEKSLVNRQIDEKFEERTADTLIREDVLQLVEQLQNAGMLSVSFAIPAKWLEDPEVFFVEFVENIQENLSKQGYRRVLGAMRLHNRGSSDAQWDISKPEDFLAATELALSRREVIAQEEIPEGNLREAILRSRSKLTS